MYSKLSDCSRYFSWTEMHTFSDCLLSYSSSLSRSVKWCQQLWSPRWDFMYKLLCRQQSYSLSLRLLLSLSS